MLGLACSTASAEDVLLTTLKGTGGRGQRASEDQLQLISEALDELEREGGIKNPVLSPTILGAWDLIYTSKSKFDITNPLGALPALVRPYLFPRTSHDGTQAHAHRCRCAQLWRLNP